MLCFKCLKDIPDRSARCPSCGQDFSGKGAGAAERGPELKEGDKVGHYVVRELIGEGPIGRVYKVLDSQFDVIAAIKLFHPEFARDRAIRAATTEVYRALIEFESDSVVKIFDVAEEGDRLFVAQDYVEGLSLRRLIEVRAATGGKFTLDEAEPIIDGICAALETLRPGEVHGDLKLENIIIHPEAVKLTDLGLTRVMPPEKYVAAQVMAGNVYLAPELAKHPERLLADPAVDVYAVGVILFQLLTGVSPADGQRSPRALNAEVAPEIDAVVQKALAPNPDERFAHLAELHLEIARFTKKVETLARLEIFLHEVPERPPFKVDVPPPPPAADVKPAAPAAPAKSKSLFDEELLGGAEEKKAPAAPAPTPPPPPAKSKMPLIAGGAVLVILLAVAAFFVLGKKEGDEQAAIAAKAAAEAEVQAAEQAKLDDLQKKAKESVARAEKARDDAIAVNADKNAPDNFVAAMKVLREAADAMHAENYAAAQSSAVNAERAFADAIIKGVEANKAAEEEAKQQKEKNKAAVSAASVQAPAKPKQTCPDGMVYVRAGTFIMGAPSNDADRNPGEKYNESTNVASFCIDRYEYPNQKGRKPAANVSWSQAKATCEKAGKRLCSETEWEKACKGPSNLKFPYAMSFDANKCNTEDSKGDDRNLAASGEFAACKSGYDVYDMSGNLWEWTESKLQSNLPDRVLRGGSFTRPDYHDRCANRYNSMPSVSDSEFGFRCCSEAND